MNPIKLKDKKSIAIVVPVFLALIIIGIVGSRYFPWFTMNRANAYDLIKESISNYIGLMGIGLAILAIIFAIIQLSYKRLSIVELIIEETYFIPVFYFGLLNILLCAVLMTYHGNGQPFPDIVYVKLVVTETYMFWILVIAFGTVFIKTLQLANFPKIVDTYLSRLLNIIEKEKYSKASVTEKELLQYSGFELKAEVDALIDENKVHIVNKIIDFYLRVLEINHNSNVLTHINYYFAYWFIRSYKKEDKDVFNSMIDSWWNLYVKTSKLGYQEKNDFIAQVPILIYKEYRKTKTDQEIRWIALEIFPIRFRDLCVLEIEDQREASPDEKITNEKCLRLLKIFEEFIKLVIEDANVSDVEKLVVQLKILKGYVDENIRELRYQKDRIDVGDRQQQFLSEILEHIYFVTYENYCWILYMIFERVFERKYYHEILEIIKRFLLLFKNGPDHFTIRSFQQTTSVLSSWIRNYTLRTDGEFYMLENEEVIKGLGVVMLSGNSHLDPSVFTEKDKMLMLTLSTFLTQAVEKYKLNVELSIEILKLSNKDELDAYLKKLQEYIDALQIRRSSVLNEALVKEDISLAKIGAFQEMIRSQWRSNRHLSDSFQHYHSIVTNPAEKLQCVGLHRIRFKGAKIMFVEKNYEPIYGIEWGKSVNDKVTLLFLQRIQECREKNLIKSSTHINAFDSIIKDFPHVNVVFISFTSLVMIYRDLIESGNYNDYTRQDYPSQPYFISGIYKEKLQLIALENRTMIPGIIGLKMPGTMVLKRRENPSWLDNQLQVDITQITEDNTKEILSSGKPSDYVNSPQEISSSLTDVLIQIDETLDFEILRPNELIVVSLEASFD